MSNARVCLHDHELKVLLDALRSFHPPRAENKALQLDHERERAALMRKLAKAQIIAHRRNLQCAS